MMWILLTVAAIYLAYGRMPMIVRFIGMLFVLLAFDRLILW